MKWTWGDEAIVERDYGSGLRKSEPCAVVGITPVDDDKLSEAVGFPVGTVLYIVEFSDGSDAVVPEDALSPLTESSHSTEEVPQVVKGPSGV